MQGFHGSRFLIFHPCCGVQSKAGAMIEHLASLAENRLIISFAPYTLSYAVLKVLTLSPRALVLL